MAGSAVVGILKALLTCDTAEFTKAMSGASKEVTDLGKKLQSDLEPRQRAINALVKDFLGGGEIRKAEEWTQAVAAIGGATKLTEQDQQRANRVLNEALGHYRALGATAPKELLDLEAATRKTTQSTTLLQQAQHQLQTAAGGAGAQIRNMALGYLTGEAALQAFQSAGRLAVQFMGDSIGEALDAEKAQRKLTAALTAQGTATPAVLAQFDELASKYQQTTIYSDDLIKAQQTMLVQVGGVLPHEMDKALEAVTNLAAGMGTELGPATMLVAKAFEDNFGALKKAGVIIDETRAKTEGMSYVIAAINAKFGGQAQADAQSYAGQIEQVKNQFAELKETLGQALIESGAMDAAIVALRVGIVLMNQELKETIAFFSVLSRPQDLLSIEGMAKAVVRARAILNPVKPEEFIGPIDTRAAEATRTKAAADLAAAEAAKKAAAEQKKWDDQIQRAADILTGRALAEEVKTLAAQLARAGGEAKLSAYQHKVFGDHLLEMRQQGAALTPDLEHLADAQNVLNATAALGAKLMGENGLAWALRNYTVALKQSFPTLDAFIDKHHGLENILANLPKATLAAPPPPLTDWGPTLNTVSHLVDDIGRNTEGAMRVVTSSVTGAIDIWQQYEKAVKAGKGAEAASAASMAGITMGFSLLTTGIAEAVRSGKQWAATVKDLQGDLTALGQSFPEAPNTDHWFSFGADPKTVMYAMQLSKQLQEAKARAAETQVAVEAVEAASEKAQTQIGGVFDRVIKIGGTLPESMRATIDQFVELGLVSEDTRDQLFGLTDATDWKSMEAAAEKYGIDLAGLGPQFLQGKLTEGASDAGKAFNDLVSHGADVNVVMAGMKDEAQDFVNTALKFGLEVPDNMRPMLEAMSRAGLLTDENGDKLEDLSRLKFGQSLADQMKPLITSIEDLIKTIRDGLPDAVAELQRKAAQTPVVFPARFDTPNAPDAGRAGGPDTEVDRDGDGVPDVSDTQPDDPTGYARGGVFSRPTLIGETQPELVGPVDFMTDALMGAMVRLRLPSRGIHAAVSEQVAMAADGSPGERAGFGANTMVTLISQIDGRQVARSIVPLIPGEVKRYGL